MSNMFVVYHDYQVKPEDNIIAFLLIIILLLSREAGSILLGGSMCSLLLSPSWVEFVVSWSV